MPYRIYKEEKTHHRVEIYSVYGCFEYTLRQDPKSASLTISFYKRNNPHLL